jgi:aminoglycoside 2''-phosphotransferase
LNSKSFIDRILLTCPELEIHKVQLINEGQFNHVLLINDEIIFRFPRYAHVVEQLDSELSILDPIRSLLPLPIPRILYRSNNTQTPGEVFTAYRKLPGKPFYRKQLDAIQNENVVQRLAEQAADFLKALHHIDIDSIGIDVPVEDPLVYYEKFFLEIRTALFPKMRQSARKQTEAFFEQLLEHLRLNPYLHCVIHNDFGGSNILYDEIRQELSGVIDFNSVCLGDPAVDVASLSTYGEDFVLRGFRVYPEMEHLMERARLFKNTFALEEALSGWRDGDPKAFERGMENYV